MLLYTKSLNIAMAAPGAPAPTVNRRQWCGHWDGVGILPQPRQQL